MSDESNSNNPDTNPPSEREQFEFQKEMARARQRHDEIVAKTKNDELELQRQHANQSRWKNPLIIAIAAATIAALGNIYISYFNAVELRELEERKAEAARILTAIRTDDPDKNAENLLFLIKRGLISNKRLAQNVQSYLAARDEGEGPSTAEKQSEARVAACGRTFENLPPPAGYDHDKWIESRGAGDLRFEMGGFVSVFDGPDDDDNDPQSPNLRMVPEWVSHEVRGMTKEELEKIQRPRRPLRWYELPEIEALLDQSQFSTTKIVNSYRGVGHVWNRGHLAQTGLVQRVGPHAGCASHVFANAVPQFSLINQGDWLALEFYSGALANKHGKIWVISGPVFNPGELVETIGDPGEVPVSIPHGLFKVLIYNTEQGLEARSVLMEQPSNTAVNEALEADNSVTTLSSSFGRKCEISRSGPFLFNFEEKQIPLDELESLTGLTFFPNQSTAQKRGLVKKSKQPLEMVEDRFYRLGCRAT